MGMSPETGSTSYEIDGRAPGVGVTERLTTVRRRKETAPNASTRGSPLKRAVAPDAAVRKMPTWAGPDGLKEPGE